MSEEFEFEEHLDEVDVIAYRWTCYECGRELQAETKKKVEAQAKQHYFTKHL